MDNMSGKRIIVIGAGASGLMAAGEAAASGVIVNVLEKMPLPGRKIRISGNGRCNLTNTAGVADLARQYGVSGGRFLRHALHMFTPADVTAFFAERGVPTFAEADGRVFPVSGRAQDVVDTLVRWAESHGAAIIPCSKVDRLIVEDGHAAGVILDGGREMRSEAVILAAGGASYPATGSSGESFVMAAGAGHTIEPIRPALVPLVIAGDMPKRLQGINLDNVTVRLLTDGKKSAEAHGSMLFTHYGVTGPAIFSLSFAAVDALRAKRKVRLSVDLAPELDDQEMDARLVSAFGTQGRRRLDTILRDFVPRSLVPIMIEAAGASPDTSGSQVTTEARRRMRLFMKDMPLDIIDHRPLTEAMVTAGGVRLPEVNPRTMESRIVPGLFIAGEALDIQADTGGFNIQAAFATGRLAGRMAREAVQKYDVPS